MEDKRQNRTDEDPQSVPTSDEIKYLDGVPYSTLNGRRYICHPTIYVSSETHAIVRNLRLRDDDVFAVGYIKSGNHWALEVLTMIQNQSTQFAKRPFREHCIEYLGLEVQQLIDSYESPRILGSHLGFQENYPKEVFERKLKIVYLIRNPKDVFVSSYHMWNLLNRDDLHYRQSFNDFFEFQIKGEFLNGDWFEHVLNFEKFMNSHPEYPVYVHSYEKMKEDPISAIEGLCTFLGKPTDLAVDIAKATGFDHMRSALNAGKMKELNEEYMDPSKEGGLFRKGVIGDWRNTLSPEQSARVDQVFDEKMSDSKLADLVRKYI